MFEQHHHHHALLVSDQLRVGGVDQTMEVEYNYLIKQKELGMIDRKSLLSKSLCCSK